MKRSILWYVSLGLATAGGLVLGYQGILWLAATVLLRQPAGSVGVIGGADGPTAVMVVSAPGIPWDLMAAGVMLIVGIVGCVYFRRKKQ